MTQSSDYSKKMDFKKNETIQSKNLVQYTGLKASFKSDFLDSIYVTKKSK